MTWSGLAGCSRGSSARGVGEADLPRPARERGSPMASLAARPPAAHPSQAARRLPGVTVADLNGALLWDALAFTKPWGSCGGETGYWRDPPAT